MPYLGPQLEHYKQITQMVLEQSERLVEKAASLEKEISALLRRVHRPGPSRPVRSLLPETELPSNF